MYQSETEVRTREQQQRIQKRNFGNNQCGVDAENDAKTDTSDDREEHDKHTTQSQQHLGVHGVQLAKRERDVDKHDNVGDEDSDHIGRVFASEFVLHTFLWDVASSEYAMGEKSTTRSKSQSEKAQRGKREEGGKAEAEVETEEEKKEP